MAARCDVLVVGGGPVGACLALLLSESGMSVTLLEARGVNSDDPRSIALSYGSALLLQRIGVWPQIEPSTAIQSVHVSQAGGFGRTLLRASEQGVPALGYVTTYGGVHAALSRRLSKCMNVSLRQGVRAERVEADAAAAQATISSEAGEERLSARLAVLADGGQLSAEVAQQRGRDYGQAAVVAHVQADTPHAGRAFERFCAKGPIALLPAQSGYALVWTTATQESERLLALGAADFLAALQSAFGDRAGRFVSVGPRAVFPLKLKVALRPRAGRIVLLGNAAQTLHPVAGQGLNLGFRDADALAALVAAGPATLDDAELARRFHDARHSDRRTTVGLTDSMVRAFSNDLAPLRVARGCGLTLLDLVPPAKRLFAQRMMFGG